MIVDDERSLERSDAPPQLDYAPPLPAYKRGIAKRIAIVVLLLLVIAASMRFVPVAWTRFQIVRYQNQCLEHRAGNLAAWSFNKSKSPGSELTNKTGSIAPGWEEFYRLISPPGLASSGTAFLGRMYTPGGDERLLAVDVAERRMVTADRSSRHFLTLTVRMIEPGNFTRLPREMMITVFSLPEIPVDMSATVSVGHRDAQDPTHLIIPYFIDGKTGVIDGWITGDITVVLEDRDLKQAKQ